MWVFLVLIIIFLAMFSDVEYTHCWCGKKFEKRSHGYDGDYYLICPDHGTFRSDGSKLSSNGSEKN